MTIAFNIDSAGSIEKTLRLIHQELRSRLENKGFAIREGTATPNTIGPERRQVWMDIIDFGPDEDSQTLNSEVFASTWGITVIHANEAHSNAEIARFPLFRDFGQLMEDLTDTKANVDLDGSVDYTSDYRGTFESGTVEGQNRSFAAVSLEIRAHHPLFPCRTS